MIPDYATIWRWQCGGVSALIRGTACGLTCSGVGWCEDGTVVIGGRGEPCEHLADLQAASDLEQGVES